MKGLSELQAGMLCALNQLGAHEPDSAVTARVAGPVNGQSTDGAAYTLRSLVRRDLVARGEDPVRDAWGYWLTTDGLIQAVAVLRRELTARLGELAALDAQP